MLNQSGDLLKPGGLTPHTRNDGFVWSARPHTGLKALSLAQITQYNEDGWLRAVQLFAGDALAQLRAAVDACEASEPDSVLTMADEYVLTYKADRLSFSRNLILRDDTVRAAALSPAIATIMHDLIGPAVRLYWDQAVYKKPGEHAEFPFHQDNGYTFVEPQAYVTLWLALVDATEDNGCPWVIPGLHRHGTLAHKNQPYGLEIAGIEAYRKDAVCVPARAGDAVIFSSLTPHRTGPNVTDHVRKALILQYIPDGAVGVDGALGDPERQPLL
ncbi:MAG: phytanoyl-CoA dioxygenase family protein [Pseudomonadota bacterium]